MGGAGGSLISWDGNKTNQTRKTCKTHKTRHGTHKTKQIRTTQQTHRALLNFGYCFAEYQYSVSLSIFHSISIRSHLLNGPWICRISSVFNLVPSRLKAPLHRMGESVELALSAHAAVFSAHSAYFNNFRQKIPYFDASPQKRILFIV